MKKCQLTVFGAQRRKQLWKWLEDVVNKCLEFGQSLVTSVGRWGRGGGEGEGGKGRGGRRRWWNFVKSFIPPTLQAFDNHFTVFVVLSMKLKPASFIFVILIFLNSAVRPNALI